MPELHYGGASLLLPGNGSNRHLPGVGVGPVPGLHPLRVRPV